MNGGGSIRCPVAAFQAGYAGKFAEVGGHQCRAGGSCGGGDDEIIGADRFAGFFLAHAAVGIMHGSLTAEGQVGVG